MKETSSTERGEGVLTRRRIRVGHLITNFAVGGAQDYLMLIVRSLDRAKFQPVVLGRMEGEWAEAVRSIPGMESYDIPALRRQISPWNDLKAVLQIKKCCEEHRIDILHTHSSKPGVVGRLAADFAGVGGVVHTIHGFSFHNFMPAWKKFMYASVERAMSPYTTVLLFVSDKDRVTAQQRGIGARTSVETLYFGVDYAPFTLPADRAAVRRELGFDSGDYVIGFSGRLSEQKGLHILLQAAARLSGILPRVRVLLVGDGPLRRDLELQADSLGIAGLTVMTGFRSDVPRLLRAMDVFVMTSLWEGLSRSLAEAMYARIPIVATDVGGTSDAIRNGETGWLVAPNSVEAVVSAVLEVTKSPDRTKQIVDRAFEWARTTFDLQAMVGSISRIYEDVAAQARGTKRDLTATAHE